MKRNDLIVKLPQKGMSFEDVVRHVLKAGPMPKEKAARAKSKTAKRRPKG